MVEMPEMGHLLRKIAHRVWNWHKREKNVVVNKTERV